MNNITAEMIRKKRYDSMMVWIKQQHAGKFFQAFGDLEFSILKEIAETKEILDTHEGGFIIRTTTNEPILGDNEGVNGRGFPEALPKEVPTA